MLDVVNDNDYHYCVKRTTDRIEGAPSPEDAGKPVPRRISSRELLGQAREVVIRHGEEEYRLRLTSQNKLILNK